MTKPYVTRIVWYSNKNNSLIQFRPHVSSSYYTKSYKNIGNLCFIQPMFAYRISVRGGRPEFRQSLASGTRRENIDDIQLGLWFFSRRVLLITKILKMFSWLRRFQVLCFKVIWYIHSLINIYQKSFYDAWKCKIEKRI